MGRQLQTLVLEADPPFNTTVLLPCRCKAPCQSFFTDQLGMPLTMEPNFEDYSCKVLDLKQCCSRRRCAGDAGPCAAARVPYASSLLGGRALPRWLLAPFPPTACPTPPRCCRWCLGSGRCRWRKIQCPSSPAWQHVQQALRAAHAATSWTERGACGHSFPLAALLRTPNSAHQKPLFTLFRNLCIPSDTAHYSLHWVSSPMRASRRHL